MALSFLFRSAAHTPKDYFWAGVKKTGSLIQNNALTLALLTLAHWEAKASPVSFYTGLALGLNYHKPYRYRFIAVPATFIERIIYLIGKYILRIPSPQAPRVNVGKNLAFVLFAHGANFALQRYSPHASLLQRTALLAASSLGGILSGMAVAKILSRTAWRLTHSY